MERYGIRGGRAGYERLKAAVADLAEFIADPARIATLLHAEATSGFAGNS